MQQRDTTYTRGVGGHNHRHVQVYNVVKGGGSPTQASADTAVFRLHMGPFPDKTMPYEYRLWVSLAGGHELEEMFDCFSSLLTLCGAVF